MAALVFPASVSLASLLSSFFEGEIFSFGPPLMYARPPVLSSTLLGMMEMEFLRGGNFPTSFLVGGGFGVGEFDDEEGGDVAAGPAAAAAAGSPSSPYCHSPSPWSPSSYCSRPSSLSGMVSSFAASHTRLAPPEFPPFRCPRACSPLGVAGAYAPPSLVSVWFMKLTDVEPLLLVPIPTFETFGASSSPPSSVTPGNTVVKLLFLTGTLSSTDSSTSLSLRPPGAESLSSILHIMNRKMLPLLGGTPVSIHALISASTALPSKNWAFLLPAGPVLPLPPVLSV
eukprot:CAMPEP_0118668462 /NCGR_PEP_ID=MMETSP0785-20121206/20361_1 /TAXON_ID=91992 /ORGANISM="Bolidomonas pacifica, Strain CCMP 1866" /LENGTH=283 /DNA_ID=CAMNT_0006563041 /DNA_START=129 /DNA_END=980 /DNA_ORIENTATION=+